MSKINFNNYEAYYLDYLEGNLSPKDIEQLFLFLNQNPELKSDLENFELIQLNANLEVSYDKEKLHQDINENNVEDYIIASIEQEIEYGDATELAAYLNNSFEAKTLAERYRKTVLSKPSITFPDKKQLKKKVPPVYYLAPMISIAAAIVLIFLVLKPFSSEKIVAPLTVYQAKPLKPHTKEIALKNEVVTPLTEKTSKNHATNLKNALPIISKQEHATGSEEQELTNIQFTGSDAADSLKNANKQTKLPEALPEAKLVVAENKSMMDLENSHILADTANKKQMPETKNLLAENTSEENLKIREIIMSTRIKHRGFKLWRVVEIGVKTFGKLNERDIALKRNVSVLDKAKAKTLDDQRKTNTPSI